MQHYITGLPRVLKSGLLALVILLPFQTFLTVWAAQQFGHLYIFTAWKEALVLALLVLASAYVLADKKLFAALLARKYNLLLVAYVGLYLLYLPFTTDVSGFWVGTAINVRFVLAFFLAQVVGFYFPGLLRTALKVIAVLGVVVSVMAIIQVLFLPTNFLVDFGYDMPGHNTSGIPPAYHLVADSGLVRAQAMLRGPNALGAYLIIPLAIWAYAFIKRQRMALSALCVGIIGLAILMSHSRSAWLGAAVALLLIVLQSVNFTRRHVSFMVIGLVVAVAVALTAFGDNVLFRQLVLHDVVSGTAQDSNDGHLQATLRGLQDVGSQPFGNGPGTAGPASALGGTDAQVSENYFLQVMQEVGVMGGLLFLAAQVWIGLDMWRRRTDAKVFVVFACGVGLVVTNLLLHTWADEAVALTWWTLAGLAVVTQAPKTKNR